MKRSSYLFLLISILLFSCKNTKSSLPTSTKAKVQEVGNIALYYELIHEAELALIRDKYPIALECYLAAIEEGTLFVKDAENALLVALESKNYTAALVFVEKLLQKGVPKTYFEKRQSFNAFRASEEWKAFVSKKKDYHKNVVLRDRISELIAMGQEYRYDDYYRDTMLVIDAIIKDEILAIFEDIGYPNADEIGVSMQNDTIIERNQFDLLLLTQIAKNRKIFLPKLEAFLHKGQINNHFFEANSKLLYPSDSVELTCLNAVQNLLIQVKDELYTCCCEAEAKIDSTRKTFYLEPLKEVRLKAEFYYERDRRFGFGGRAFKYTLRKEEKLSSVKESLTKEGFVLYKKLDAETAYFK